MHIQRIEASSRSGNTSLNCVFIRIRIETNAPSLYIVLVLRILFELIVHHNCKPPTPASASASAPAFAPIPTSSMRTVSPFTIELGGSACSKCGCGCVCKRVLYRLTSGDNLLVPRVDLNIVQTARYPMSSLSQYHTTSHHIISYHIVSYTV